MIKASGWLYTAMLAAVAIMLCGLFLSRAALSIGMIGFFLLAIFSSGPQLLKCYRGEPYYGLLALLVIIPILSGFWSHDLDEWWRRCVVKLPFIVLPLGFAALVIKDKRVNQLLSGLFVFCVLAGSLWSTWQYLQEPASIHESYLRASVIPTWFEDDHVRFSLAVVIALLLLYDDAELDKPTKVNAQNLARMVVACWLILYLHILAAKTGLISLYLSMFIILVRRFLRAENKLRSIFIFAGFIGYAPDCLDFLTNFS